MTFTYKRKSFPVGHALVDTGSDCTILPLAIAHVLEVELDDTGRLTVAGAGGGSFTVMPSLHKVGYRIEGKAGFRSINWQGIVYFAEEESVILLGHRDCLEKFDLTFQGPEKILNVLPRFKA